MITLAALYFVFCSSFYYCLVNCLGLATALLKKMKTNPFFAMKLDRCRYSVHKIFMTQHISCLGSHLKVSENCS